MNIVLLMTMCLSLTDLPVKYGLARTLWIARRKRLIEYENLKRCGQHLHFERLEHLTALL